MTVAASELAVNGGAPICTEKFPMWPSFTDKIYDAIRGPLEKGQVCYWTGPKGMEFEEKWAAYNGVKFAITTTNGTSALHTALGGLGIGPGDEVIVPSYTFIASSFCVLQAGAIPVFADVTKGEHVIDPADIERKITPRTKAIIPVHLYGVVCDMDAIMAIAKKHNLFVVEDCAQCFGGEYKGKKTGTIGDVGAFSFCQSKHFTTGGEGGAVITNNEDVAWECRSFRDHGYDVKQRMNLMEMEEALPYVHNRVGFNYRMTEVQSVIGMCELERFESWNLKNRHEFGKYLQEQLKDVPQLSHLPIDTDERKNAYWWFPMVVDLDKVSCDVKTIVKAIGAEGVPVYGIQWPESYRELAYRNHGGFGKANFPFESKEYTDPAQVDYKNVLCENAAWHRDRTFNVFTHPVYTEKYREYTAQAIKKVLAAYAR